MCHQGRPRGRAVNEEGSSPEGMPPGRDVQEVTGTAAGPEPQPGVRGIQLQSELQAGAPIQAVVPGCGSPAPGFHGDNEAQAPTV